MSGTMSAAFLAALLLCAGQPPEAASSAPQLTPDVPCQPPSANWHRAITEDDAARLRQIRSAWVEALAQARGDHAAEVAAGGALLDPDSALLGPAPPPGEYDCRTIKLGTQATGGLTYVDYPRFRCRIAARSGGSLSFVRLNGSQRPIGRLFPDTTRRMVFLGTVQLGDEQRAYRYGADTDRDEVAVLERIGESRWRLVFPRPHFESRLDIIELVPRVN
ncbi:DUF4893 domain-containing protein [Sphingosinicella ginsenosidimutans]|uniref:DUF4893 domain-containing protein n=2 Tax=Allosphingosinicella ginsenosidimutans TaxID=1176539 RepID=A0A5C6TTI2_9SPHN|nr:DUF4893 domain-containing protein [Sphingosinicella ginsenosidimutans]TXC63637.1 DUF4893 domain-containing protein [Sphingosinicella ginsenosidimutans]